MEKIFLTVVNMSVSATWFLLAVLILRFALKKAPRGVTCVMWALVGVRLAIPFFVESSISFLPSAKVFPDTFLYAATPKIDSGIEFIDNAVNPVIGGSLSPELGASANPTQVYSFIFAGIWIFGAGAMIIYMVSSFIRVKLCVREAVLENENVWLCDRVDTPFILGIIRPKIYLPSNIERSDAVYVIAHEKAHIKRLDYLWKPLGFLLLAVHWFNPAMWLAYVLFCRDIEFACDEKVIRELNAEGKREYSEALLNLSVPKRMISACPLAFGEVGVKERIKSVLGYKKPSFGLFLLSLILVFVAATGFLTSPYTEQMPNERLSVFIDVQIHEHTKKDYNEHMYRIWEFDVLDIVEKDEKTTVYMWLYYGEYSEDEEHNAVCINMKKGPVAITAKKVNDYYELVEYKSAENMESAKKDFPSYLHGRLNYLYNNAPPTVEREIWDNFFNIAKVHFKTLKEQ